MSLPGGKVDEGDADAKATALREAKEEIGLDPAIVSVVTVLEPFLSKVNRNFLVPLDCYDTYPRQQLLILPTSS